MLKRITLVGYRASGKSTVGPLLAKRLGWRFIDADRHVEQRLGQDIASFFAAHEESAFRDHEAADLVNLLAGDEPLVLATGGGAVLREANRTCMRARGGLIVYLHASATVLQGRLRLHAGGRPSLSGKAVWEEVPDILAVREPLYREVAALVLDATRPPIDSLATLIQTVENLWLKPVESLSKSSTKPSSPAG